MYFICFILNFGQVCLLVVWIIEIKDWIVIIDGFFVLLVLVCYVYLVVIGWIDFVIGWVECKLSELVWYVVDMFVGGGLQNFDYLILQLLNWIYLMLMYLCKFVYVYLEWFYMEFLQLVGEFVIFVIEE